MKSVIKIKFTKFS